MTEFAVVLIVMAAFCHATWNFLAKRVCGGTAFIWLFATMSSVLYFPVAVYIFVTQKPVLTADHLMIFGGSAILHSLYFFLLDKGYKIGDLSLIYPLARGTGPLLSVITAILFLGEHPSWVALSGAAMIGVGIVTIMGNPAKMLTAEARKPLMFAVLCGTAIAAYTIVDKVAVSMFLVPPLLLDWSTNFGRVLLLTPYAIRNWHEVQYQFEHYRKEIAGVAILSPLSYIMVLTAMVYSPVSYIAPAREISILIGTVLGAKLLAEENYRTRIAGAATMLCGLVALSVG